MRKLSIFLFIIMATVWCANLLYAGELDESYNPTRKEWLELSLFKIVKDRTDSWNLRINSAVLLKEDEGEIYVTLTTASGGGVPDRKTMVRYIEIVNKDIQEFIKTYSWSKALKISIHFV